MPVKGSSTLHCPIHNIVVDGKLQARSYRTGGMCSECFHLKHTAKIPENYLIGEAANHLIVEIDTEAGAAYIRFAKGKVARTEVIDDGGRVLVTCDLDRHGKVLGVEYIGVKSISRTREK